MLLFLCWRTITGLNKEVSLDFLVAGHTKNVVIEAFGHVKRKLKCKNARTLRKMMRIVKMSSTSPKCIAESLINWILWKDNLESFFKIPSAFGITTCYCLEFFSAHLGIPFAKENLFSPQERIFKILRGGTSVDYVRSQAASVFSDSQYEA